MGSAGGLLSHGENALLIGIWGKQNPVFLAAPIKGLTLTLLR